MASTLTRIRDSALPRFIDRMAGTPLLWLWGALRHRRPVPPAPRRFGVMMFETIGDTLLAGTVAASLRAAFPGCELVVFVSQGNRGVMPLFDGIARVVEVPLTRPVRALAAMRSEPVDVMIDIGQWPRWYALLCAASRSRCTIGFATPGQARHHAYDAAVPHGSDVHEVQNFQRLLQPLGAAPLPPAKALRAPGLPPARLELPARYVVVHPWASGFRFVEREWPLERWLGLAGRCGALGLAVLITGSAGDRTRAQALLARCPAGAEVRSLAGELSLSELAAVLRAAAAVVSVNTGVMHLAWLLDAPLVALHGPTSRRRLGPLGEGGIALAPAGADCEFLDLGFEYPSARVNCMERIALDEVVAALRRVLEMRQEQVRA